MKIRTDFVTNSSSSSFVVAKAYLTPAQIYALLNDNYGYSTSEDYYYVHGWTIMDNGELNDELKLLGIDPDMVVSEGGDF